MNINSIISFLNIMRAYPKLSNDRKEMQKTVNKLGDEAFKTRKKKLHDDISLQKKEVMECYDKYKEIVGDGISNAILNGSGEELDILQEKLIKAFLPEKEEGTDNG